MSTGGDRRDRTYHVSPDKREHTATAPYNFVPLPRQVLTVADPGGSPPALAPRPGFEVAGRPVWQAHDRFLPGTLSGRIELTITTLTPLFIRGPAEREDAGWPDSKRTRLRAEPFTAPHGSPLIPGSSLRGMTRSLVEILASARIAPVSGQRPFFRAVGTKGDRLADAYLERIRTGAGEVAGGFVRRDGDGDGWFIEPASRVLKVVREVLQVLEPAFQYRNHPSYTPSPKLQHRRCSVAPDAPQVIRDAGPLVLGEKAGWRCGTLVLSGSAPNKGKEFVFVHGPAAASTHPIPDSVWERFHDEDQITGWQEKAFPKSKDRPHAGALREGEPVFFVLDDQGAVRFLGRAGLFRFPYDRSPAELIPETHPPEHAGLDLAESIFGTVRGRGADVLAIRGRVRFGDCRAQPEQSDPLLEALVPRVLSGPKVTSVNLYLTQDGPKGKKGLQTYLDGDVTDLRGHKLYWHRWDDERGLDAVRHERDEELLRAWRGGGDLDDTQVTVIRPVRADVTFRGTVHFENLLEVELGALLSALQLPDSCAHKLGMGKPLGLGSVRVETTLSIIDRSERYSGWSSSGERGDPVDARGRPQSQRAMEAFMEAASEHARKTEEARTSDAGVRSVARLDALFLMLEWDGRPPLAATEDIGLERFYDERPKRGGPPGLSSSSGELRILATPHAVVGRSEPTWLGRAPGPRSADRRTAPRAEGAVSALAIGQKLAAQVQRRRPGVPASRTPLALDQPHVSTLAFAESADVPVGIKMNDRVEVEVLELGPEVRVRVLKKAPAPRRSRR